MLKLRNGKPIEKYLLEQAMDDSDLSNAYFLNTRTGEVVCLSGYDTPDEREKLSEEIDGSSDYTRIDRIESSEAYQWMVDFIDSIVTPKDEQAAEKLSIAIMGKGAFRRFKDVLYVLGDEWEQQWYHWRDERLQEAMDEWLESVL